MTAVRIIKSTVLASVFLIGTPTIAHAENMVEFGNYVIHYNALPTDILLPEIARAYKIKRSNTRGMLNIVVQTKTDKGTKGITAKVTGTGSNLNSQLKHLSFRELKDGDVIYYITDFRVTNKELITFKIKIQPTGSKRAYDIKFRKEFFTH